MNEKTNASGVARFTKILLDIMFYCGIAATVSLPWSFRWAAKYYPSLLKHYGFHVVLFMISAVGAVLIIFELRRMFRTVLSGDCFVEANVKSLRNMGWLGIGIAVVTAMRLFILLTPATLIIIVVFFVAGLFSFVLSQVFDRAVRYKEENDLTI